MLRNTRKKSDLERTDRDRLKAQTPQEGKLVRTLVQQEGVMKCGMCMALAFLPGQGDSVHLLAGYEDGTVALWAVVQPSRALATVKAHAEPVMALAAMPGMLGMSASM